MLIDWGIEQAVKDGTPAYLEGGVMGKPIHEKYGFRQMGGELDLNLEGVGGDGRFSMAKMVYNRYLKDAKTRGDH